MPEQGDALRAALAAASDAMHEHMYGDNGTWKTRNECDLLALAALRAIPTGVGTRLFALDRGGMTQAGRTLLRSEPGGSVTVPVYRLTTEATDG
jgi:hypothetical protein